MNLLKARRSRREFTEQGLGQGEIDSLLEAAAQAPNGLNRRNVHFAVVTDRSALRELSSRIGRQAAWLSRRLESPAWRLVFKLLLGGQYREIEPLIPLLGPMAEATMKGRDMVLYNAPCAILIHTGRGDPCGAEDSVYCGANILLAAEALGLGACVVGFLTEPVNRSRDLARLAGIPRGHKVHTSIVAGRPRFPYARAISRPVFNPSR
jgi:nitroreductase